MGESLDSKFNVIMNAIASLSQRTAEIERIISELHNDKTFVIEHFRAYQVQNSEEATYLLFNKIQSCYNERNLALVFMISLTERVSSFEVWSIKLG